ncbi:MAG TPA: hypothetical protein VK906_02335 [Egicoccus sp.]|nr:hypothetical protein [Egicoccus sp.]HSK21980.1 hypothetical protein [Egicoccus sp.]
MQFLYFGRMDPPHVGHLVRIAAVQQRWRPTRTVVVPLDAYDGRVPGRRIVRTRMAAALAETTDALYTDQGLAVVRPEQLLAQLAEADEATVVLFDPELPPGLDGAAFGTLPEGAQLITDGELELPRGLPTREGVLRAIRNGTANWQDDLVPGVAPLIASFDIYAAS